MRNWSSKFAMQGHTLLMRACMLDNTTEACWLVELGADVNARSLQTVGHCNALSIALGDPIDDAVTCIWP